MTAMDPKGRPHSPEQPVEPAQGTVDTQTQYRDRPSDDGKHGDAAAQPRPNAAREDAARH
jgi:hypothetical protein